MKGVAGFFAGRNNYFYFPTSISIRMNVCSFANKKETVCVSCAMGTLILGLTGGTVLNPFMDLGWCFRSVLGSARPKHDTHAVSTFHSDY